MDDPQTETDLLAAHRKEQKELQSKIQSLKHGVAKGDKKKKKQVTAEIAVLEAELEKKQEKELEELRSRMGEISVNGAVNDSSTVELDLPENVNDASTATNNAQKMSKAQKRRNKKTEKAKEREEAILLQEVDNLSGARNIEIEKLNSKLLERGLAIYEVPSDGDCLYKAVEHQLRTVKSQETTVVQLRRDTCDYMLSHRDDFHPFLVDAATGDMMSVDQYDSYCRDIASKPTWGGHVEIQALSHVCKSPIEVIQADSPSVTAGESYQSDKLILCYHRHMYGLGEHYNSVVAVTQPTEAKDD